MPNVASRKISFPTPAKLVHAVRTLRYVLQKFHQLEARVDTLSRMHPDEQWETSRSRWRAGGPSPHLTWGKPLTGSAFIAKARSYGVFSSAPSILEVGPGYGRLLRSLLEQGVSFRAYTGIDISQQNVAYLQTTFKDERLRFRCGDAESVALEAPFDLLMSSLTLKHIYPSFQNALSHLFRFGSPHATAVFDLIEAPPGTTASMGFEHDGVTYIRHYSRAEVKALLEPIGLEVTAFDTVQHDENHARLFVVARRQ